MPANVGFGEGVELTLVRSGDVVTMSPARTAARAETDSPAETNIRQLIRELDKLPKPSCVEVRDTEIIPEPKGL